MEIIKTKDLNLYYGKNQALKNINMSINKNEVTALIGPSGCGKSTFLRTLNRMNDLIEIVKVYGKVYFEDKDIYKDYDEIGAHLFHGERLFELSEQQEIVTVEINAEQYHKYSNDPLYIGRETCEAVVLEAEAACSSGPEGCTQRLKNAHPAKEQQDEFETGDTQIDKI